MGGRCPHLVGISEITEVSSETENYLNINDTGMNVWDAPSSRKAIMRRVK